MSEARPYVLFRRSDLSGVRERVEQSCGAWAREWLGAGAKASVEDVRPIDSRNDLGDWLRRAHEVGALEHNAACLAFVALRRRKLANALLAVASAAALEPLAPLEERLVDAALADLGARLAAGAQPDARAIERTELELRVARELGPGAGWLACRLQLPSLDLQLLLPGSTVRGIWPQPVPAAPSSPRPTASVGGVLAAMQDEYVTLPARIGVAELTVAELTSLNVGDVIRLDVKADEPLGVTLGAEPHYLRAFLGLRFGAPALQITGVESISNTT